jgi:hypothetical protein
LCPMLAYYAGFLERYRKLVLILGRSVTVWAEVYLMYTNKTAQHLSKMLRCLSYL